MGLFTKNLDELRDEFVKWRQFPVTPGCRSYAFDEAWIDQEHGAERPDMATWLNYIIRLTAFRDHLKNMTNLAGLLYDFANDYRLPHAESISSVTGILIASLSAHGLKVYRYMEAPNRPQFLTVAWISDQKTVLAIHTAERGARAALKLNKKNLPIDPVLNVLLQQWDAHNEGWAEIRDKLIEILEIGLRKTRQESRQAFDRAVAVSNNGSSILMADQVVVVDGDGTMTTYEGSVFYDNKIFRDRVIQKENGQGILPLSDRKIRSLVGFSRDAALDHQAQLFIRWPLTPSSADPSPPRRVLVTPRRFVPDLPADTPTIR